MVPDGGRHPWRPPVRPVSIRFKVRGGSRPILPRGLKLATARFQSASRFAVVPDGPGGRKTLDRKVHVSIRFKVRGGSRHGSYDYCQSAIGFNPLQGSRWFQTISADDATGEVVSIRFKVRGGSRRQRAPQEDQGLSASFNPLQGSRWFQTEYCDNIKRSTLFQSASRFAVVPDVGNLVAYQVQRRFNPLQGSRWFQTNEPDLEVEPAPSFQSASRFAVVPDGL